MNHTGGLGRDNEGAHAGRRMSAMGVVALILLVSILVACVPATTPTPQATAVAPTIAPVDTAAPQPTVEKAKEPIKIVWWSMFAEGEGGQQLLDKYTKQYMAANPNIQIEIKWVGRDNVTQLSAALAGGTQVDIVDNEDQVLLNTIVNTDLALPLDEYMNQKAYDSDLAWKDTFVPGSVDVGASKGNHYLIPRYFSTVGFFYNVKMLQDLGVEPAAGGMTWDQFLNLLNTIKTKLPNVSPLGSDNDPTYNQWYYTYMAIRVNGVDAFREAAMDKTGEKWGDPGFLQAAKLVEQVFPYMQPAYEGSAWPAAQVMWVNGQVAIIMCGSWLPKEMIDQTPDGFQTNIFAFPEVPGGKGNQALDAFVTVAGVMKDTKHPDEVIKYLQYITSNEVMSGIAATGSSVALKGLPAPSGEKNQTSLTEKYSVIRESAGLTADVPEYVNSVYLPCDDQFFHREIDSGKFITCLKTESAKYWGRK